MKRVTYIKIPKFVMLLNVCKFMERKKMVNCPLSANVSLLTVIANNLSAPI